MKNAFIITSFLVWMLPIESTESIGFNNLKAPRTAADGFFEGFNQAMQQNIQQEMRMKEAQFQSELRIREQEAIMNFERQQRIEDENRYRNRNEKVDQVLIDVERISNKWHQ